ncbi:hypothetical protein GQ472_05395 [archaeon]|nr:hypothetical protein [archaeon]
MVDFTWTDKEIKGKILHKLTRLGKFKHSHTSIDNLPKGFPADIRGKVKNCVKELIREDILFRKPTSYGMEISVNTKNKEKIMDYINTFLEKD